MAVPMPAIAILFVCKVVLLPDQDTNSGFTNFTPTEWDMTDGMMHCRREQIALYDQAVDQGAIPIPYSPIQCARTVMTMGPQFDVDMAKAHKPWRFWRGSCPTPIRSGPKETDEIIGWKLPECPNLSDGTVICDKDSVI